MPPPLSGRRCHRPALNDRVPSRRAFSERAAINAPIQGSAADVIRRAMIRMPGALEQAGLGARMLLPVHDELIVEVPDAELEATADTVREIMENAALPADHTPAPRTGHRGPGPHQEERGPTMPPRRYLRQN